MQDINKVDNEDKNWQWEYLPADKLRSGMDIQLYTKECHVMRIIANGNIITLRVKEVGKQDVEEVNVYSDTIIKYKKIDAGMDWINELLGGGQ